MERMIELRWIQPAVIVEHVAVNNKVAACVITNDNDVPGVRGLHVSQKPKTVGYVMDRDHSWKRQPRPRFEYPYGRNSSGQTSECIHRPFNAQQDAGKNRESDLAKYYYVYRAMGWERAEDRIWPKFYIAS